MIVLAAVLAAMAAYLFIGLRYMAPRYVTRAVSRYIEEYPMLASDASQLARQRREESGLSIGIALTWPVWLTGLFLTGKIAASAPLTDFEAKQKIAERDRRIAELEQQLEVGK